MEEDEEDQDIQPGNTELDEDYDSDVIPAEKSFFYHEDEHGADLEEDRVEEIAPNLCQDRRQKVNLKKNLDIEADPESTESTLPGGVSEQNRIQDYNVLVKNPTKTMEICRKWKGKIINGVRCKSCLRALHWKCGGITKNDVKVDILNRNGWDCAYCRNTNKDCQMCKKKDKEIMNLKTIIADFEKNTEHMNYELRICNERCTDLEDRLYREKKLRRKVEEDLYELEERHRESSSTESSSSGDESDSSSEPRSNRKDHQKSRDKKKVGLPKTGGRSSERGNRCKV